MGRKASAIPQRRQAGHPATGGSRKTFHARNQKTASCTHGRARLQIPTCVQPL